MDCVENGMKYRQMKRTLHNDAAEPFDLLKKVMWRIDSTVRVLEMEGGGAKIKNPPWPFFFSPGAVHFPMETQSTRQMDTHRYRESSSKASRVPSPSVSGCCRRVVDWLDKEGGVRNYKILVRNPVCNCTRLGMQWTSKHVHHSCP